MSSRSDAGRGAHLLVLAATGGEARAARRALRRTGLDGRVRVRIIGIGPERAMHETRRWLVEEHPGAALLAGVAGGLADSLEVGDVVVPLAHRAAAEMPLRGERAVDARLEATLASALSVARIPALRGIFLTSAHALSTSQEKGAYEPELVAVEMEGLAVATVLAEAEVPFASLRTVLDPRLQALPDFSGARDVSGRGRIHLVPRAIVRRPRLFLEILSFVTSAMRAQRSLERALVSVLPALVDALGSDPRSLERPGPRPHDGRHPRRDPR